MQKSPTVKIFTDGISQEEAVELLSKAVEKRHNSEGQRFESPLMEDILETFDRAYRTYILMAAKAVLREIKAHADK